MTLLAFVALLTLSISSSSAGPYSLVDSYQGGNFFSTFQFFTGADPTHGRVYARFLFVFCSLPHYDENIPKVIMFRKTSLNRGAWPPCPERVTLSSAQTTPHS